MKINIQIIGRVVSLALCAVVVTISLCVPAKAAPLSYDPDEYISNVIVNGDLKTVYFDFSEIPSLVDVWENPSRQKTQFQNVKDRITYRAHLDGSTSLQFRTFFLGVETWDNQPAASRSVIDISDIMPGASLDMNMSFGVKFTRISAVGEPNIGVNSLHVRYNFGFYMYDKYGAYVGTKWGSESNSEYEYGHTASVTYNPGYSYTFPANVAYLCPFVDITCSDDIDIFDWMFELSPQHFQLSCNINMIYDNSSTMDRIEEELDDIENAIQEGNDKLDDIISGGDAADAVKPDNDKISDSTDKMDDAMDDMNDAMASIPTAPTDLGSLIDDEVLDKALSNGAVLFDWDASGLINMFPPLGLSCGLSVLFYTIFGKKG